MNTRTRIRPAIVILATATITAVSVTDAHGATLTQTYSGTGWKIAAPRITHLDTRAWTVEFADTTSRTKLTAYAKATAAELKKHTGLTVTVTTKVTPFTRGKCVTGHKVILKYDTQQAFSLSGVCGNAAHAADGGYVLISATNWNKKYTVPLEAYRKNVTTHEVGHVFGLDHPTSCGTKTPLPLMCNQKWGGYWTTTTAGRFAPQDINGLRALVANRTKVPPVTAP